MRSELSPLSLGVMSFVLSLCVTPLQYPGFWLGSLGTAAVAAPVAASLVGIAGTLVAARFAHQVGDVRAWRRGGGVLAVALAAVVLAGGAENMAIYARVAGAVQTTHFPLYYDVAFVLAGAAWAGYFGAEGAGRAVTTIFPLLVIGLAGVYVWPLGNVDARNLFGPQPALATGADLVTWTSLGVVRGYLVLLVWGGRVRDLKAACRAVLWGVSVAGALIALSVVLSVAVFGLPEAVLLRYPFTAVTGTLHLQWFPTSSLEALVMVVWQLVAFGTTAVYVALACDLLGAAWRGLDRRLALAAAAAAFALAGLDVPSSTIDVGAVAFNTGVLLVCLAVPGIWLLASSFRRAAPEGAA